VAPQTKEQLIQVIMDTWDGLDIQLINRLVASMPTGPAQLQSRQGNRLDYKTKNSMERPYCSKRSHQGIMISESIEAYLIGARLYAKFEKETQQGVLIDTQVNGDERTQTFADLEREKRTSYDGGTITYSDWTPTRTWEVKATRSVVKEIVKNELVSERREQRGHWERRWSGDTCLPSGVHARKSGFATMTW
jgi:hypothetical protein